MTHGVLFQEIGVCSDKPYTMNTNQQVMSPKEIASIKGQQRVIRAIRSEILGKYETAKTIWDICAIQWRTLAAKKIDAFAELVQYLD